MQYEKKVGRPTADASAELTQRITQVATQVFLEKGYANAGMEEISSISGVAKRSLYSRFPNKALLFCHVMKSYSDQAFEGLDGNPCRELTLEQQLGAACLQILRSLMKPPVATMQRVITGEAARFPELAQSLIHARSRFLEYIASILHGSAPCEDITPDKLQCAAGFLFDMVITPEIHRAALGLVPCEVTETTAQKVEWGVKLFLRGFLQMHCSQQAACGTEPPPLPPPAAD